MKCLFAVLTAVFILLAGCGSDAAGPSEENGWKTYTTDGFTIQWRVEQENTLRLRLSAPTTGWVAVGFDPTLMMMDANFIIGYVQDGTGFLRDDFGTGVTTHQADTTLGGTHDATLIQASESGGRTELEFTIPMDSGDIYDTVLTRGATHVILLAYGPDGAKDFTSPHQYAKAVALEL